MISIEIDGKRERIDGFFKDSPFFPCGVLWGIDEKTKPSDAVRNYLPTSCVWPIAVYRKNSDGSYFGIEGLFTHGEWTVDENGDPLYRVWDRSI